MDNCNFTIYVNDLQKSREFYYKLFGTEPEIDIDETLSMSDTAQLLEFHFDDWVLCIRPVERYHDLFGNETGTELSHSNNIITRTELFFYVENRNKMISRLEKAGGKILHKKKEVQCDQRIEITAYGSDPDGNILAFCGK